MKTTTGQTCMPVEMLAIKGESMYHGDIILNISMAHNRDTQLYSYIHNAAESLLLKIGKI